MEDKVKEIRKDIIRKFCRTVLWIDDEIRIWMKPDEKANMPDLFQNKVAEFEASGLLCHLKGFPSALEGTDPYADDISISTTIDTCVSLAQQSDILIIDWMLGSPNSSKHAKSIIRRLLEPTNGFKFIVILSQADVISSSIKKLDETLKQIEERTDLFQNKSGQFILTLRKSDFDTENLFNAICKAIFSAYPDYLHLAAMEIAGRIKECVPKWLSAVPLHTDLGVLVERGSTMYHKKNEELVLNDCWNVDLQECLTRNLVEDLEAVVLSNELNSLRPDVLKPSNRVPEPYALEREDGIEDSVNNGIKALKDCLSEEKCSEFNDKQFKNLSLGVYNKRVKELVEEIDAFSEFCDKRSGYDVSGARPCPGAVFKGLMDNKGEALFVCISAACDCIRSESLLFLKGEPMERRKNKDITIPDYDSLNRFKGGKTILCINGSPYVFRSVAHSVLSKPRNECASLDVVGVVRMGALNRLISRFVSQTQRYGVNQPSLVRKLRKSEGDL